MRFVLLASAMLFALPLSVRAQTTPLAEMPAGEYTLDTTHASITWRVNHLGLSQYTARFARMSAVLHFNPQDPTQSKLTATVDPLSLRTDFPTPEKVDFDKELATGKDWFNGVAYPVISFRATGITKTGDKTADITGELTMLGARKTVVLHTTFNGAYAKKPYAEVPGLGFSATTTLKRSEWGMTHAIPFVGDEVQVMIEAEFNKAP
jgi:polyisoprenoid-binding protein YceI